MPKNQWFQASKDSYIPDQRYFAQPPKFTLTGGRGFCKYFSLEVFVAEG